MLAQIVSLLNRAAIAVSSALLLGMMLLACSNMLLRFLGFPVKGTFELMGFGGAVIAALALGGTQARGGHIEVDLLSGRIPARLDILLRLASFAAAVGIFSIMAWRLCRLAAILHSSGEVSETLHIVYFPVVAVVALGVVLLIATIAAQILQLFKNGKDVL